MRKKKGESTGTGGGQKEEEEMKEAQGVRALEALTHTTHGSHEKQEPLEHKILENLVELQKVHTALAEKFDKLANQITQLLSLFEMAARSFAERPANQVAERDREFLEKVDRLLEQNKTIAKGLTLVEERIRERIYRAPQQRPPLPSPSILSSTEKEDSAKSPQPTRPLPRF